MADASPALTAEIGRGVGSFSRPEWDAVAGDANPFVSHDFLTLLEDSGSVGAGTGWSPVPLVVRGSDGAIAAALPAYVKDHSQGEYVFDHAWADAWRRAGGDYYPKLQIAAPFSPVPGPRLLTAEPALGLGLCRAAEQLVHDNGLSSAHATFVAPDQIEWFRSAGWLIRTDSQFHWRNRGYADFDAFLEALSSRKRKAIRKERSGAAAGVDRIVRLTGEAILPEHWAAFWHFYQDTGARKWGTPYLTRQAFDLLGERMADRIVLVLAQRGGQWVAGALNLLGRDTIYGRYWGAVEEIPFLHFELCYYQAIDIAIERGLATAEAGAQGSHKLARGYEPTPTYSAHYIADRGFRSAVSDFLDREREAVAQDIEYMGSLGPFKRAD